jgi:hypothetical protein
MIETKGLTQTDNSYWFVTESWRTVTRRYYIIKGCLNITILTSGVHDGIAWISAAEMIFHFPEIAWG